MKRPLPFAALLALAAALAPGAALQQGAQDAGRPAPHGVLEPLDVLRLSMVGLRERAGPEAADDVSALLGAVAALESELAAGPSAERARAIAEGLLDLGGFELAAEGLAAGAPPEAAPRASPYRRTGLDALARHVRAAPEGDVALRHVLEDVLLGEGRHPSARRLAALALVRELRPPRGELALLALAHQAGDPLDGLAQAELATWPGPAADLFLVRQLGRPRDRGGDPHPVTLLLKRLREHAAPLAPAASRELEGRVAAMMLSTDWRQAATALELSRGLASELRVPLLIESLRAWARRAGTPRGSKRFEHDLLLELQRFSHRGFGADPERWALWWRRVRTGEIQFSSEPAPRESGSQAQFFGLRPISDRLTFVLDRSGSMDQQWGTTGRSRYAEAVEQTLQYLQAAGADTWFNVILFNQDTLVSSVGLRRATADHLELARRALLAEPVGGGTRLRPAIEQALCVEDGALDLAALAADTVIVLCDGQTEEGPAWVAPFLEAYQPDAQVKFHCVLLGSTRDDDGTLARLAEHSGGSFLRIGG